MPLGETCALKLFPLIARLVLCAAFLPLGWQKIFSSSEYSMAQADQLVAVGVTADGMDWQRVQMTGFGDGTASSASGALSPATAPRTARSLYHVALAANSAHFPYPAILAWIVALTEFGGAILLLAGLFTRVAAFFVACTMAGAFWITSVPAIKAAGWWNLPQADHLQACAQVGLLLIAANVVIVGSGFLSVDGMLGRKPKQAGAPSSAKSQRKDPA